jgi:hypothetical protein
MKALKKNAPNLIIVPVAYAELKTKSYKCFRWGKNYNGLAKRNLKRTFVLNKILLLQNPMTNKSNPKKKTRKTNPKTFSSPKNIFNITHLTYTIMIKNSPPNQPFVYLSLIWYFKMISLTISSQCTMILINFKS